MCTGTTPACGTTCGRGAGTHGDVLNLHTEVFGTDTRGRGREREERKERGGGHRQFCLPRKAHEELSRASERFTERNPWFLPIQGLRTGREQHVPESSNHSLYLMKLLSSIFILRETLAGISTHNTQHTHTDQHIPTDPPTTTLLPSPSLSLTHAHANAHVHARVYVHARVFVFVCICICRCVCKCICVCVCASVSVSV